MKAWCFAGALALAACGGNPFSASGDDDDGDDAAGGSTSNAGSAGTGGALSSSGGSGGDPAGSAGASKGGSAGANAGGNASDGGESAGGAPSEPVKPWRVACEGEGDNATCDGECAGNWRGQCSLGLCVCVEAGCSPGDDRCPIGSTCVMGDRCIAAGHLEPGAECDPAEAACVPGSLCAQQQPDAQFGFMCQRYCKAADCECNPQGMCFPY